MSATIPEFSDNSVAELCQTVQTMTYHLVQELLLKWNEMYELTEAEKEKRFKKLREYLQGFFDEILQCEEEKRQDLLTKIDSKMKEFYNLQQDLSVIGEINRMEVKTPYSEFLKDLDKSMAGYLEQKEKRIEKAKKLRTEEQELCEELGLSPIPPFNSLLPTEQEIDDLQLKLFELHEEKINRLRIYKNIKNSIINLSHQIERNPISQFEKDLYLTPEQNFRPSAENMVLLEQLKNTLQKEYDDTIKRRQHLLVRLAKLWDRLKVTSDERESFLAYHNTISKTHMAAIEAEIDRCEKLKLEKMQEVIESARVQISMLWDKVTYTQEQRLQFSPFLTERYTEDVLLLHEAEIDRLERFYLDNRHIFELAEKRNNLWERMLHLEALAQDKTRLFSNRGGQLLKEEKERKELESSLPKVDKQLKAALAEYGKPFLWNGRDLLEKITQDWDERIDSKTSQKITRKVISNTPSIAEAANTGLVRSACKQKRGALTPSGGNYGKMRKCNYMESATTPKRGVRTPIAQAKTPLNTSGSSLASYSRFHDGIERSAPRAALREVGNTPGVVHSSPLHVTPRRHTPASNKKTPKTIPRLATCRKRLPIDI